MCLQHRFFQSCQLRKPYRFWAKSVCVDLKERLCWRRGAVFHRVWLFEKTQEARKGREAVSIQTRGLMMETRLWRRKQGFGDRVWFSPISNRRDRGDLDWRDYRRKEEYKGCSSFLRALNVKFLLCFGVSKIRIFLSRPCWDQG